MSVLVVDIMCKSLLPYELDLLYNDNLIKCDTILKNKNISILMWKINYIFFLTIPLLIFLVYSFKKDLENN